MNVMQYFRNYLQDKYGALDEELIKDSFIYITKLFTGELSFHTNDIIRIENKVKKLEEDREKWRNAVMPKENYSAVRAGKNTGGRPNSVEIAMIEILNINEEIIKLMAEKKSLEITANNYIDKLIELLDVLTNDTWRLIMQLSYIDKMNATKIVNAYMPMNIPGYVRKVRHQARKKLAEEFVKHLKNGNT